MEAINHAGACVGILAKDGVVLAAEKKILSKVTPCDVGALLLVPVLCNKLELARVSMCAAVHVPSLGLGLLVCTALSECAQLPGTRSDRTEQQP